MGKKAATKSTAAKTITAASKASTEESSGHQTGDWARSLVAERDIAELKSQGLLHGMEYQLPGDEEIPNPPEGWRVMFLAFFFRDLSLDRKSTRLNSSHSGESRMPSSA